MAEYVREVTVTIEVDTNKRTLRHVFTGNTIAEATARAAAYVTEHPDWDDLPTPSWECDGRG